MSKLLSFKSTGTEGEEKRPPEQGYSGKLSVGRQVFLTFALILVFVLVLAFSAAYRFYYNSNRDTQIDNARLSLNNSSGSLGRMLDMAELILEEFYADESVRSLISAGDAFTNDALIKTAQSLRALVDKHPYFERAAMRIQGTDLRIYAGHGENGWVIQPEEYSWAAGSHGMIWRDGTGAVRLRFDYPRSRPLSSMEIDLDQTAMWEDINPEGEEGCTWLYQTDGTPLFPAVADYPPADTWTLADNWRGPQSGTYRLAAPEGGLVLTQLTRNNSLLFIRSVSFESALPITLRVFRQMYPYLMLLMAIVAAGMWVVLRQIWIPLRQIAYGGEAGEQTGRKRYNENEIKLVRERLQKLGNDRKSYDRILEAVSGEAENRVLGSMILDQVDGIDSGHDALSLLQSPFVQSGPYLLQVIQWEKRKEEPGISRESYLLEEQLRGLLTRFAGEYWKKDDLRFPETQKNEVTVLVRPNPPVSAPVLRRRGEAFLHLLEESMQGTNYRLLTAGGAVLESVSQLPMAYQEAIMEEARTEDTPAAPVIEEVGEHTREMGEFLSRLRSEGENTQEEFLQLDRAIGQKKSAQEVHLEDAKAYIARNYRDSSLSLESISDYLGISAPYLSTLFRQYEDMGFVDYLNKARLREAKILLADGDMTVAEISGLCGFASPQSFIRVFRRYCGETPGNYRSRKRGKEAADREG